MALVPITTNTANRMCTLLLGASGIGKTSQLRCLLGQDYRDGSWVQTELPPEKVLVLSAEGGLLCVRDLIAAGQVEGYELSTIDDFREALRYCYSSDFTKRGYKWVFIDSLTEVASRCADSLQRKYPSKADSFKLWGEYNSIMTDVVKSFRDLPTASVVFSCLLASDKDADGRRVMVPDISGASLKQRLVSYFDESVVMERITTASGSAEAPKQQQTLVFNTREPVGVAKDRSGRLQQYEYPNLLRLRDKILSF